MSGIRFSVFFWYTSRVMCSVALISLQGELCNHHNFLQTDGLVEIQSGNSTANSKAETILYIK